jgi:hypothetical protein
MWWIMTKNNMYGGPWSHAMTFTVPNGLPGKAALISPSGYINTTTPLYQWNAVPSATWYQLWVNDAGTPGKIQEWHTASEVGCPSGTGTCSVTPSTNLASGFALWWIQTWNEAGYGPWSDPLAFNVNTGSPGKPAGSTR